MRYVSLRRIVSKGRNSKLYAATTDLYIRYFSKGALGGYARRAKQLSPTIATTASASSSSRRFPPRRISDSRRRLASIIGAPPDMRLSAASKSTTVITRLRRDQPNRLLMVANLLLSCAKSSAREPTPSRRARGIFFSIPSGTLSSNGAQTFEIAHESTSLLAGMGLKLRAGQSNSRFRGIIFHKTRYHILPEDQFIPFPEVITAALLVSRRPTSDHNQIFQYQS